MKINGTQLTKSEKFSQGTGRWLSMGLLFGATVLGQTLAAETYERVQPKLPGDTGIVGSDAGEKGEIRSEASDPALQGLSEFRLNQVLLEELSGLVFVDSESAVQKQGVSGASGVTAEGSLALLAGEEFAETVAAKYLWQPVTLRQLNALNRDTVRFLRQNGFPVVDVILPEQDITGGSVQLIILKGRVGEVTFSGNQFFDTALLAGQVKSQSGDIVTGDRIREDLNWINRNPFRQVNLLYSRGDQLAETDLTFQVEDRRPLRFYAGYENSGSDSTNQDRIIAGVNWGNAFGLDHQANYQFSTAPDKNDFYAHSGSYLVPLPWRHVLSAYGAYANSSAEVVAGIIDAEGESYTFGLRYVVPLRSTENFNHELFAGFEYKYSENSLIFSGSPLPETKTEVGQFNLGYSAGLRDKLGATNLTATVFHSPGNMFTHNDDAAFQGVVFEGDADYTYGRLSLERTTRLPHDFTLMASVTGQISNENLLISEQLGAGGYATVRGYNEREANAEEGIMTSVELRSPSFSVSGAHGPLDINLPTHQLQLLTFWDYAHLERHSADPTSLLPEDYSLSSAGLGLRLSMTEHFSLRFDYGWQLKDSEVGDKGDSRGHVGLVFSY